MKRTSDQLDVTQRPQRDPSVLPTRGERDRLAVRGGVFTTASRMVLFVISIGSAMIVARLLTPSEFGLFAMSSVLFGLLMKVRNLGLIEAIVQAQELDEPTLSALFWRNTKINVVVFILSLGAAPLLAWVFGEAELVLVVVAIAAVSFGRGLSGVHEGVIRRQVRYTEMVRIDVIAVVISTAVVIVAAYAGLSYWALVLQEAVRELLVSALIVVSTRWLPARSERTEAIRQRVKHMTAYGVNLSAAMVINYIGLTFSFILIGRFSGAAALGIYEKAFKWSRMPFQQFYIPVSKVAMSKFSRLQDDSKAYCTSVFRTVLALYCGITLIFAVLFTEARSVILILFGDQWVEVIPLFQILIIGILLSSIFQLVRSIMKAEGRTNTIMRWSLVVSPVMLVGSCIGAWWGSTGVAIAYLVTSALLFFPTILVCTNGSHLRPGTIMRALWPPVFSCAAGSGAAYALRPLYSSAHNLVTIMLSGLVILVVSTLVFLILPGGLRRVRELQIAFAPMIQKRVLANSDIELIADENVA